VPIVANVGAINIAVSIDRQIAEWVFAIAVVAKVLQVGVGPTVPRRTQLLCNRDVTTVTNYAEVIALTIDGGTDVSRDEDCETTSFQG